MTQLSFENSYKKGEEIIRLDNVGVRYGDEIQPETLQDLTMGIQHGSFYFLTGPSGAGKSTLLKLLYLDLPPSRGLVRLFGKDVHSLSRKALPDLRRRIGVVFQNFRLIKHMTAMENVSLPLKISGMESKELDDHVIDLLKWVGLGDKIHALPETLSGGEQQRVAIARAVMMKPGLLIADEPTGNVDDEMASRLVYLFEQLNKMGTTVIIATHSDHLISQFDYPQIRLEGGRLTHV